jgi:hypothetical protein
MIAGREVLIILDRNQNGLDGRPVVAIGGMLGPGVYWDPDRAEVVAVDASRPADRRYIFLSPRRDVTADELVRELAMGGGGASGRAVPYHARRGSSTHA